MRASFTSKFRRTTCMSAIALGIVLGASPAYAQDADNDDGEEMTLPGNAGTTNDLNTGGEPIVVTGSRIARDGFAQPTPVTVVGNEQIERQGVSNVAQVLNDIPAFRPQSTPATTAIFQNNIGANTADLRGLGANRTLVLIDGRRVVPATVQGSSFAPAGAVDLNMVPTSLLERVR